MIDRLETPAFVELSMRASPFRLRLPPGTPTPAWTRLFLENATAYQAGPGPDLAHGHKMPAGMPLDMDRSALTGFVFVDHPVDAGSLLAVGVTDAERFESDRVSTDRFLDVLRTVSPDLVTDVGRSCTTTTEPTASLLAALDTAPLPAFTVEEVGLGQAGWFVLVGLDVFARQGLAAVVPSLLTGATAVVEGRNNALRLRVGTELTVERTGRTVDLVLTAAHLLDLAKTPAHTDWIADAPDPARRRPGVHFLVPGMPLYPTLCGLPGGGLGTAALAASLGAEVIADVDPSRADELIQLVNAQQAPLRPGALRLPEGWTGRFTAEATDWTLPDAVPTLRIVAHSV
ncbi:MAG: hypothetical protein H6736_09665 [Alphaproteobacteria bacterium]|nr:hypothetical protein [Alphaproteobacteria bacterium]MCB9692069.1 hypothetical protein [Alphaproteobacteria bacterium]